MDALLQYSIPVKGLGNGMHDFDFQIDKSFFESFDETPIQEGQFDVRLLLDKRPDMIVLHFVYEGSISTECDRCLEKMSLPIQGQNDLLVKYAVEDQPEEADIVYINLESQQFNVAKFIYEFICLGIPMIKTHDDSDEDKNCDPEMLKYLESEEQTSDENPIWDALKDFKK